MGDAPPADLFVAQMCGIVGEVDFDGGVDVGALATISELLRHRGPDDKGMWLSPDNLCGLAHRRLSVIDLSPGGHQPMIDPNTGTALVYNGEIYNFYELREHCKATGARFRSNSDTEVLLTLYRLYGKDCVRRLRGMFAFVIWDSTKRELFFARDRMGKKPLNYALTKGGLVFASEIGPLARHPLVTKEIDDDALDLYLQLQYIPSPWSIYKKIRKLPAAHYAVLNEREFVVERYWDPKYQPKLSLKFDQAEEVFHEILTKAVRLRTISDVPFGALLSGGVDSSIVVAIMASLSNEPIKTFSVGFEDQSMSELTYAEQVAHRFGTNHHPQIVQSSIGKLLRRIAMQYGEPYGDHSAVPSFLVCEAARQKVTVALSGDGGDELLGGYSHSVVNKQEQRLAAIWTKLLTPGQLAHLALNIPTGSTFIERVVRRVLRAMTPEYTSLSYTGYWDARQRRRLLPQTPSPSVVANWRTTWLIDAAGHADNAIEKILYIDAGTYLADCLMPKMDIASMQTSLEMRSPLLDSELVEFCAQLPTEYKVSGGVGKLLLKRYGERYFSHEFLNRKKMGFSFPVAQWLRGPLREELIDVLRDPVAMEPMDVSFIHESLQRFLVDRSGTRDATRIWTLLMYGLWRRHSSVNGPI